MSYARATELARLILDDLRGACYYADPKVLGGLLKSEHATEPEAELAGIGVCITCSHGDGENRYLA